MKLNVIFKETQMTVSGDETSGIALEHGWYNSEYANGTDKAGDYYVIPMANVAYMQIPGGAPPLLRQEIAKDKLGRHPDGVMPQAKPMKQAARVRKPKKVVTPPKAEKPEWLGESNTENVLRKPMGKPKK